jgi:hypothetical protein
MMIRSLPILFLVAFLSVLTSEQARGLTATVDVTNVTSVDGLGDSDNTVLSIDLNPLVGRPAGQPLTLTGIGWDVSLTTVGTSWLNEPKIQMKSTDGTILGFVINPGSSVFGAGTDSFSSGGILDLANLSQPNLALPTGTIVLQFYEEFDDFPNSLDATWTSGDLLFDVLPVQGPTPDPVMVRATVDPAANEVALTLTNLVPGLTYVVDRGVVAPPAGWNTVTSLTPTQSQAMTRAAISGDPDPRVYRIRLP